METVLTVARLVPDGIVCLLTALRIHGIGTQSPPDIWMAIHFKARPPKVRPWQVRFVRWSGAFLTYGVEDRTLDGVQFRITSPTRTIIDCFRYRNKIGLDVALEALTDGLRRRKVTVTQIARAAQTCRAWAVMRPYLESAIA
jgi:predicted transcriptional regulator of viral defense system